MINKTLWIGKEITFDYNRKELIKGVINFVGKNFVTVDGKQYFLSGIGSFVVKKGK